jgi:hypothetical protein
MSDVESQPSFLHPRPSETTAVAGRMEKQRMRRDQGNAFEAWPEPELFGTRLGPNKNGTKW